MAVALYSLILPESNTLPLKQRQDNGNGWATSIIFQIGILGNGFTIFIMLKSKKMRSQTVNKFLINQSAIDFLASFFLLATCNARYRNLWLHRCFIILPFAVADPGFPRGGGANPQGGGANLLFGQNFPQNGMNIKKFGPRGGVRVPGAPLDPPMLCLRGWRQCFQSSLIFLCFCVSLFWLDLTSSIFFASFE